MASRGAETTFAAAEVFFACGAGGGRFFAGDEARSASPVGVVRFAFGAREALEAVVGRELVGAGGGVVAGTGVDVAATAGVVGRVAGRVVVAVLDFVAVLDVFAVLDFGAVLSVSGASGLGVAWTRVASEGVGDERAGASVIRGASAIRGAASLRAPTGGASGMGADAAAAEPERAAARTAAHAATATPSPRSVRRRDDVLLDTRPSLLR